MTLKLLLLLALLAVVVWWAVARTRRGRPRAPGRAKAPDAGSAAGAPEGAAPQAMLQCARCKLHMPRDEAAFDAAGRPYCSLEHRVAGPD